METAQKRTARLELKTTQELKQMIAQAAALSGMDTTSFLMVDVAQRARKVLMEHQMIHLSLEGQRRFAQLNEESAKTGKPTEAMRELAKRPRLPLRGE
ncbi:MAG: DUF1778 domain-containing protein [Burkholderiaceae bacterium]|nr:DUF1778 domain-containing protein [Burkholderiaceae bacterium]MDO9090315.1 DUF1778 domain-containing protein [Burkholderiaceae bacterium]MDP1968475.1 DUF1778 domain-containing protein [Burkholderiaceae bacterium]